MSLLRISFVIILTVLTSLSSVQTPQKQLTVKERVKKDFQTLKDLFKKKGGNALPQDSLEVIAVNEEKQGC